MTMSAANGGISGRSICLEDDMPKITFEISHKELFEKMTRGTDDAIRRGVNAGAKLLATYTKNYGRSMWRGPYATGTTIAALTVEQKSNTKAVLTYNGENRRGVRNAEVAFINEYGKRGQAARPVNRAALDDNEEAIWQRIADEFFKDF